MLTYLLIQVCNVRFYSVPQSEGGNNGNMHNDMNMEMNRRKIWIKTGDWAGLDDGNKFCCDNIIGFEKY